MGKQLDGLTGLRLLYDALVKANDGSLRAAYSFGQIADALTNSYTYLTMADELGLKPQTVARYARLYRRYTRVEHLLDESKRLGTFNIATLAAGGGVFSYHVQLSCADCGGKDIISKRERVSTSQKLHSVA